MKTQSHSLAGQMMACCLAVTLLFMSVTTTLASGIGYNTFLPVISQASDLERSGVQGAGAGSLFLPAFDASLDFNIDPHPGLTRLQHISENGGSRQGGELTCGARNQLEVYWVNSNFTGPLTVQVIHTDHAGHQWQELHQIVDQHGARFTLYERATVQLIPNALHRHLTSAAITISTDPRQIPFERLITSGYCSDDETCQQLIEADACHGSFGWNVVFSGKK